MFSPTDLLNLVPKGGEEKAKSEPNELYLTGQGIEVPSQKEFPAIRVPPSGESMKRRKVPFDDRTRFRF
jgi:hypothetical protein